MVISQETYISYQNQTWPRLVEKRDSVRSTVHRPGWLFSKDLCAPGWHLLESSCVPILKGTQA